MRKKEEKKDNSGRSISQWEELAERYFDALTDPQEELELKRFLSTPQASSPRFDEIKAVMGYFATRKAATGRQRRKRSIIRWSAAAVAAGIISAALWHTPAPSHDICIAYIDGKEITDERIILEQMQHTMQMISNTTEENSIEKQLGKIFN